MLEDDPDEMKKIDSWLTNLNNVIISENDVRKLSHKEIYGHINALKTALKTLRHYQNDKIKTAIDIINGWEKLNAECENNPELKHDWEAFLCIMKLQQ